MKKFVVEIVEKITYKVEFSADSQEYAERRVREIYDSGAFEGTGELESVTFDVEEKEDKYHEEADSFCIDRTLWQ